MTGDRRKLLIIIGVFLIAYFLPVDSPRLQGAIIEAVYMVNDYAREHVLLCLIPAFFIAGGISIFISQGAVLKYFGAKANKFLSYTVAAVSGTILAVCSCTILPLFAGIYKRGAGIGPATAFLYSGPAINVMAIIVTARVLGPEMGIARAVAAILFSVIIGLIMHLIYRNEENEGGDLFIPEEEESRPLWKNALYFAAMIGILVFANWGRPIEDSGIWAWIFNAKWILTGIFALLLLYIIVSWFQKDELKAWVDSTWDFAKQILPLLFGGVLIAGLLLGRPGFEGLIPSQWVETLVGGNSIGANFFASLAGAFMYFATLTEVPILQGLMGAGMGKGPALALLLAGPALSLPNMLVIRSVMGTKKTVVFVALVVIMATIAGLIFGTFF
ncbi:hypothetical protein SAMN02745227_01286 [Anaerobranca californiensis DSM 14826]|uniref:Permease n=1 Tax=Anaerobranca californiensis DSM 14826 TaxID=1120989 RepID=A0A1M6NYT8_9FIRM|nr:permease [Anaerobranca californiensis]SHK00899.1 hypothetical protein SAMN02745227_01286 [Anaerobranca californiensis DSM 14826]